MERRNFLKALAGGAASLLGIKNAQSQTREAGRYHLNITNYDGVSDLGLTPDIVQSKQGVDYLADIDVTSIIYAYTTNKTQLKVDTSKSEPHMNEGIISYGEVQGKLDRQFGKDSKGKFVFGYICDSNRNLFSFDMKGRLPASFRDYEEETKIVFQGHLANKPISFTVNKNGELPVDASGEWGGLEIKAAYKPSQKFKWLLDSAEIGLYALTTKALVAKYSVKFVPGLRKTYSGPAIGYAGFTVTRTGP